MQLRRASLSWGRFALVVVVVSLPFAALMLILRETGDPVALLALAFGWIWMLVYAVHRWRALRKRFGGDGEAMRAEIKQNPLDYMATSLRDSVRWVVAAAAVMMVFAVVMGLRGR